jgi:hypothetical protein
MHLYIHRNSVGPRVLNILRSQRARADRRRRWCEREAARERDVRPRWNETEWAREREAVAKGASYPVMRAPTYRPCRPSRSERGGSERERVRRCALAYTEFALARDNRAISSGSLDNYSRPKSPLKTPKAGEPGLAMSLELQRIWRVAATSHDLPEAAGISDPKAFFRQLD